MFLNTLYWFTWYKTKPIKLTISFPPKSQSQIQNRLKKTFLIIYCDYQGWCRFFTLHKIVKDLKGATIIPLSKLLKFDFRKKKSTFLVENWKVRTSEDSDQPGHPPCLIRVFVVRMKKPWVLSYPLSTQRRLWSDWVDAEADRSLRWAHRSFCWFCRAAAHMYQ